MKSSFYGVAVLFVSQIVVAQEFESETVVKKVVENRNQITDYHVVVKADGSNEVDNSVTKVSRRFEAWKKGDKYRTDITTLSDSLRPIDTNLRRALVLMHARQVRVPEGCQPLAGG